MISLNLSGPEPLVKADAPVALQKSPSALSTPTSASPVGSGWWPLTWIREGFSGAWQRNIATPVNDVMTFGAVFSCV